VDLARKVASTDASVMLVGESGTGKELIAQFLHSHSSRANRSLVR
jgi:transcriptional regulator with PAS, ATPase and Fis domain